MTLEQILTAQKPSDLFNLNEDIHLQYKQLAKFCHPDINKDSQAVEAFKHLSFIYNLYKNPDIGIKNNQPIDYFILESNDKKYKYIPRIFNKDECGEIYLGNSTLRLFDNLDLFKNHDLQFKEFLNKASANNFINYVSETYNVNYNNKPGILYKHKPSTFRLKEIIHKIKAFKQPHVIWITNRLLELAAYLESINIVHCNISLSSVYIIPETHGISLCDWQYSRSQGHKLLALNGELKNVYPKEIFKHKQAINQIDINLIKHLGIQLLGDPSGFGNLLKQNKDINQNILKWFQTIETNKSILDIYTNFRQLCEKEIGKPKFYKLELNNIY